MRRYVTKCKGKIKNENNGTVCFHNCAERYSIHLKLCYKYKKHDH